MDQTTQTLTVTDGMTGRIDKELGHHFPQFSRSQLKRWIDDGTVTVNGQTVKAKYQLQAGDRVVIEPETPVEIDLEPENIPLDIVYEDDDVLVVNKPQGMVVHPAPGHPNHTLVIAPMNTNTIAGSTIIFCRFSRCAYVSGSRSFFGFPVSGAALFSFVGSFFVCSI